MRYYNNDFRIAHLHAALNFRETEYLYFTIFMLFLPVPTRLTCDFGQETGII